MKKKKMLIVIPAIICICGLLVCTKMGHFIETNKETSEKQLQEINSNLECQDQTQVLPDATLY